MFNKAPISTRTSSMARHSRNFVYLLLVGALFLSGCHSVRVGGLPDAWSFTETNYREDKPVGGSAGISWEDEKGRERDLRAFAGLTPPRPGEEVINERTRLYIGFWLRWEF